MEQNTWCCLKVSILHYTPNSQSRQLKVSFIESNELNLPCCRKFETYPPLLMI